MRHYVFFRIGMMVLLGFNFLVIQAYGQQNSRDEAIERIAKRYPNSSKSPEQIYDEGQIDRVARAFSKRFGNWDLSALTGPLEEDSIRVVSVKKRPPVIQTPDIASTKEDSTNRSGTLAFGQTDQLSIDRDSTAQTDALVETRIVKRRSVFYSKHEIVTTVAQDYNNQDKRVLRRNFLKLFRNLPSDVRIILKPIEMTYHGQTATVDAEWKYDILGLPTPASQPYVDMPTGKVKLQLRRVEDEWLISNFQGLLANLNNQLVSR